MNRGNAAAVLFGILACTSPPHFASASSVTGASECPCLPENSPKLSGARAVFSRLGYAAGKGPSRHHACWYHVQIPSTQGWDKDLAAPLRDHALGCLRYRVGIHKRFGNTITAVAIFRHQLRSHSAPRVQGTASRVARPTTRTAPSTRTA